MASAVEAAQGLPCSHTGWVLTAPSPQPSSLGEQSGAAPCMACPCSPPQPRKLGPDSEDLATDSVRAISISTLYLVSTTVDRMSDVSVCARPVASAQGT